MTGWIGPAGCWPAFPSATDRNLYAFVRLCGPQRKLAHRETRGEAEPCKVTPTTLRRVTDSQEVTEGSGGLKLFSPRRHQGTKTTKRRGFITRRRGVRGGRRGIFNTTTRRTGRRPDDDVFNIPMRRDKLRHGGHQDTTTTTTDLQEVTEVNGGLKLFSPRRHQDTKTTKRRGFSTRSRGVRGGRGCAGDGSWERFNE